MSSLPTSRENIYPKAGVHHLVKENSFAMQMRKYSEENLAEELSVDEYCICI